MVPVHSNRERKGGRPPYDPLCRPGITLEGTFRQRDQNAAGDIPELPTQSASPPTERTVLVSFRQGTNWITRTYDCNQQPPPLRRILQVIGEREELAERK